MTYLPQILAALLFIALLAWYLSFSASRLDRLHHRIDGARSALDAQLVRRAEAAMELGTSGILDPASGLLLVAASATALEVGEANLVQDAPRERAESDLSQSLRAAIDDQLVAQADPWAMALLTRLATAGHRVQLARIFVNSAATDAQLVHGKRVVRWARLAGRAPLPQTFEMDDEPAEPFTKAGQWPLRSGQAQASP